MRYYASEADSRPRPDQSQPYGVPLGQSPDLLLAEFVRTYDIAEDCSVLELGFGNRTYVFDAGTVVNKMEWIAAVEAVMDEALQQQEHEEKQRKDMALPPVVS